MSSDYGLLRALLKRLPLSKAFKAVSLKRKLRPISKKETYRAPRIRPYRLQFFLPTKEVAVERISGASSSGYVRG
jgi:hypothetical protein